MRRSLLKNISGIMLTLILVSCSTLSWAQIFKNSIRQGLVKVKFKSSMSETVTRMQITSRSGAISTGLSKVDATAKAVGVSGMYRLFPYDAANESRLRKHGLHLWYVVEIEASTDPRTAVMQFKQLSEIEIAEVDREKSIAPYNVVDYKSNAGSLSVLPFNDPYLKDQWHYNNTGQTGFGGIDINLFEAWTSTTGSNDVIVSVHDEGVDVKHEDLKANIWVNADEIPNNGIDDDNNGYIDDINGFNFSKNKGAIDPQYHGTHVAGTIAAVNNNGKGVSGVAGGNGSGNGAKIMSLQILGGGLIERSYVYAANNGAVISQNSWGYASEGYFDQSVIDAIKYFIAEAGNYVGSPMRGGIVIFAAGNSNSDGNWYPARYASILSVSSLGPEGKRAPYSNYGDWVEIAAPGGDQISYPSANGVLSTIPGNKYSYIQGTSMACPHVSGIAALVLANRTNQLTSAELWNKLVTGVSSIDTQNPDFIGKLGSGAIDAALAIQSDAKLAPQKITDLTIEGIAQEFATLSWTVPVDEDDRQPVAFSFYYHTSPITSQNLSSATKVTIKNSFDAGSKFSFEVSNILGLTTYYFAVTSSDRWGNTSLISNVASASTNAGPSISVVPESIDIEINANESTSKTSEFDIINSADGILRWTSFMRHRSSAVASGFSQLQYPVVPIKLSSNTRNVGRTNSRNVKTIRTEIASTSSFTPATKNFSDYPTNIVGETNTAIPNSAAGRFFVTEDAGFNLTDVGMYLKHDPAKGPVIVEIYSGESPVKNNLLHAQEYSSFNEQETWANVVLDEQLYFEKGSTFWVAFHIPSDNLYPLGIGFENQTDASTNCFMSFNVGATWQPLEDALNTKEFAWVMAAGSYNQFLGTYLTLDPGQGDVNGNSQSSISLTADASQLMNGTYSANVVIASNDAAHREVKIPINLIVEGHRADIRHVDIADFGSVFVGDNKTFDLILDNQGYGNLNDVSYNIDGDDFEIENSSNTISAREESVIRVTFNPSSPGNKNATLTFSNGTYSYSISLFGVAAETSRILVSPESQSVNDLTIGDEVSVDISITNEGYYPLKYFIPGFDTKGVSENWPSSYHRYGYKVRSNRDNESNPIAYSFQDISGTGVDITSNLIKDDAYFDVEMGFTFPYYGKNMHKIYIAQKGFTTFDNTVRPINAPSLNNANNPGGYISLLGTFLTYVAEGRIYYKLEADRLIIQYDHVTDGNSGHITAQMVLLANGDIRFYYEDMGFPESAQPYLNILMEDIDHSDGILLHDFHQTVQLNSGSAYGFDYPGPDIITSVTNGSGILAPGSTSTLHIALNTASLSEGVVNRYINIVCNDPLEKQKIALVELHIDHGGEAQPVLSEEQIDFGDVFQGDIRSRSFAVKNSGTASIDISSITSNSVFPITGQTPVTIKPGFSVTFSLLIPTTSIGELSDVVTIHYVGGISQVISVTGNVVAPPAISVDLSAISETVDYGQTKIIPIELSNPGSANLEFTFNGKPWAYFRTMQQAAQTTYDVQKENTGGVYQWMDIRKTGTHLPFMTELNDETQYWRNLTLPFEFNFYGSVHSNLKIGDNGVISFEEAPPVMTFNDSIPSTVYEGAYIMPYWASAGYNTYNFKKEDVGIFYQLYADKVIITWSYLVNFFGGMGDPVSAQVILYKNGMIRFQYKIEEGGSDLTSNATLIGVQKSSSEGVVVSDRLALDLGEGLVFDLLPSQKFVVEPDQTISGEIVLDATNTYAGNYSTNMRISSNAPGSAALEKPVSLTIDGAAELTVDSSIDFGNRIVAVEDGMPVIYPLDLNIQNNGTTPVDISWIEMASGSTHSLGIQLYLLVDGWFGSTWEWVDASYVFSPWNSSSPVFQIMPGDKLNARAMFYPSEITNFNDEIIITTTIGEKRVVLTGAGIGAPLLAISRAAVNVSLNSSDETTDRTIAFDNMEGKSPLEYDVKIEFDRLVMSTEHESISTSSTNGFLQQKDALPGSGFQSSEAYRRTIRHTERTSPDNHVGSGGSEPFIIATKFNAGNQGFNLSHVETWFRAESEAGGSIEVEIRAGNSITESTSLLQKTIAFSGTGDDQKGNWLQLALGDPVFIYPNEDFFVLITYPFGIKYPQGFVKNEPSSPGRYWYSEAGTWHDIQNDEGYLTSAWLVYAAEMSEQTSSWITITSPTTGTLGIAEQSNIQLTFDGDLASHGDQLANIVLLTNDPANKIIRIPVKLHMNEAPMFGEVSDEIVIKENEAVTLSIPVIDIENNSISVSSEGAPSFATTNFDNGILEVTLLPTYGDAGNYTITLNARDEYNAVTTVDFDVIVQHANQAPLYIGAEEPISIFPADDMYEYSISEFFGDPDNDLFTFSVVSDNEELLEVFASSGKFLLKANTSGAVNLHFMVRDIFGAVTQKLVPVVVNVVLAGEENQINSGVKIFPNPATDIVAIEFGLEWSGEKQIEITDMRGLIHNITSSESTLVSIDVSDLSRGMYILKSKVRNNTSIKKLMIK